MAASGLLMYDVGCLIIIQAVSLSTTAFLTVYCFTIAPYNEAIILIERDRSCPCAIYIKNISFIKTV